MVWTEFAGLGNFCGYLYVLVYVNSKNQGDRFSSSIFIFVRIWSALWDGVVTAQSARVKRSYRTNTDKCCDKPCSRMFIFDTYIQNNSHLFFILFKNLIRNLHFVIESTEFSRNSFKKHHDFRVFFYSNITSFTLSYFTTVYMAGWFLLGGILH